MKCKKIVVKKKDIKNGQPTPSFCPIALASYRVFGPDAYISVDRSTIDINGEEYNLPKKAQRFVERFDDEGKVKPFSFCIRLRKPVPEGLTVSCR